MYTKGGASYLLPHKVDSRDGRQNELCGAGERKNREGSERYWQQWHAPGVCPHSVPHSLSLISAEPRRPIGQRQLAQE